ncbi:MAG: hypothetical protein D6731_17285 [Planctomycetota bacterium]|nr:MAG: hypothetical protein D6731_17285 [Planctomycetota bacterium]
MSASVAGQRARSQLRFLVQAVDRFERFHAHDFVRQIRDFDAFFTGDDVVGLLWGVLHRRLSVDVGEWHAAAQRAGRPGALPADPVECLGFRFATLRLVRREKLDLRYYVSNLYPGDHLNERLMHWKREVVHPLAADLRTLVALLLPRLEGVEWVDLAGLYAEVLDGPFRALAFGPRAWTDADDEALPASVPGGEAAVPAPWEALVDRIESVLREAPLPARRRADLLLDAEALRLELRRKTRRLGRIRSRLAELAPHAAEPCDALARDLEARP